MSALVLAPVLLAVVLVVSALGKLRDPSAAAAAFDALRVPPLLAAPWLRRALPWAEITLGVAVVALPRPFGVVASLAAVGLFAAYTWLVARALRSPEDVNCSCFGSLTSGRVTRWTLVRNVTLVAVAALAVVDSFEGRAPVVRAVEPGSLGWVTGAAVVAWVVLTILHEPVAQPDADVAGAESPASAEEDHDEDDYVRLPIPFAELTDASGATHQLRQLARQRAVLLVWLSLGCGSCQTILDRLPEWADRLGFVDVRPVFFRSDGVAARLPTFAEHHLLDPVGHAQEIFTTRGTPMAVLLGADGLVAGGPVLGVDAVTALVEDIIAQLDDAAAEASGSEGAAEASGAEVMT